MKMSMSVYGSNGVGKVAILEGISKRHSIKLSGNAGVKKGGIKAILKTLEEFTLKERDVAEGFMKWLYTDEANDIGHARQPFKMYKYSEGFHLFEYVVVIFDVGDIGTCALIRNGYITLITFDEYTYLKEKRKWAFEGNIAIAFLDWIKEAKCDHVDG